VPGTASSRRLLPRPTIRLRLTLLYGGLFLVAGAVLLAITYELVAHSPAVASRNNTFVVSGQVPAGIPPPRLLGAGGPGPRVVLKTPGSKAELDVPLQTYAGQVKESFRRLTAAQGIQLQKLAGKAKLALQRQQSDQRGSLLTWSGVALGIMAILSIGLGWLVAGRALRPVRTMSARARGISERNLHERLALEGPDDELKELGDTFDELLARLESAFASQRQFVANASHELRTPITLERALVEVALADPVATAESLRTTCERVLAAGEQQARLIEALLTLARSQRGLDERSLVHVDKIAGESLRGIRPSGVRVDSELGPAVTLGDRALIERLVGNLIDNALRYNLERRGWVTIWTGSSEGRPVLRVSNSGPAVPEHEMGLLTQAFHRVNGDRTDTRGAGLGLSIVAAIAAAHGAELRTTPRRAGGLDVEVSFSPVAADQSGVTFSVDVAGNG
jgi:signal transduction histidine kinase